MPRLPRVRGIPWRAWPNLLAMRRRSLDRPVQVLICIADHFEPGWGKVAKSTEHERVARWVNDYPTFAGEYSDSHGRPPQHTFFFPIEREMYDPDHVDRLAHLCRTYDCGDVEIHLHHGGESSQWLHDLIGEAKENFVNRHGLLTRPDGTVRYGFVHGNWALDNSHPRGEHCGINDELTILRETGCYADFTMPSAPAHCQTGTINSIYFAVDDPRKPNSHDHGVRARVGMSAPSDGLLMVQGPLALNWAGRSRRFAPRLENGSLHAGFAPTRERLRLWLDADVHVEGRPEQVFIKLHTHGATPDNADMLLGPEMHAFHRLLRDWRRENSHFSYRYVTAFEMAAAVDPGVESRVASKKTVDKSALI